MKLNKEVDQGHEEVELERVEEGGQQNKNTEGVIEHGAAEHHVVEL